MRQQEEGPHKQDEDEAAVLRVPEQGCLLELETMVVDTDVPLPIIEIRQRVIAPCQDLMLP